MNGFQFPSKLKQTAWPVQLYERTETDWISRKLGDNTRSALNFIRASSFLDEESIIVSFTFRLNGEIGILGRLETDLSHSMGDLGLGKTRAVDAEWSDHVDPGATADSWESHGILQIFDGYNLYYWLTVVFIFIITLGWRLIV